MPGVGAKQQIVGDLTVLIINTVQRGTSALNVGREERINDTSTSLTKNSKSRLGPEPGLRQPHPQDQRLGAPTTATLGAGRRGGGEQRRVGWMAFDGRRGATTTGDRP